MKKEDYLQTVADQIRCRKAHEMVLEELENHIEDQTAKYMEFGLDKEEATGRAVREMGDPVETGVMLDRIHRPKMAWDILIIIGIISIIGLLLQFAIAKALNDQYHYSLFHQLFNIIIGFGVMVLLYFLDYSFIGRYAHQLAIGFFVLYYVGISQTIYKDGAMYFFIPGGFSISVHLILYLFIPIFGGLLYQYYHEGYKGLFKSILWMLLSVFTAHRFVGSSSLALQLMIIQIMMLFTVICRGWFKINKKIGLGILVGVFLVLPLLVLLPYLIHGFQPYQIERIMSMIGPGSNGMGNQNVKEVLSYSSFVGGNITTKDLGALLPNLGDQYMVTYVICYYGVLGGLVLLAGLILLLHKLLRVSIKQKNQLGMIIGVGCSMVLGVQSVLYLLDNVGVWATSTLLFLPFISYGLTGNLVSFMLLGILLSIYRNQNILPNKVKASKKKRYKNKVVEVE